MHGSFVHFALGTGGEVHVASGAVVAATGRWREVFSPGLLSLGGGGTDRCGGSLVVDIVDSGGSLVVDSGGRKGHGEALVALQMVLLVTPVDRMWQRYSFINLAV